MKKKIAVHLGPETLTPPVEEVVGVVRQNRSQVRADLARVLATLRYPGDVATAVLGGFSVGRRVGRDGGRVEIAVYPLGDPVGGERGAEPAKHVVAREPPPADIEEHRAYGVRAVKVVEDPEQLLLTLYPHTCTLSPVISMPLNSVRTLTYMDYPMLLSPCDGLRYSFRCYP